MNTSPLGDLSTGTTPAFHSNENLYPSPAGKREDVWFMTDAATDVDGLNGIFNRSRALTSLFAVLKRIRVSMSSTLSFWMLVAMLP